MRWLAVLAVGITLRLVSWNSVARDARAGAAIDGDSLYHCFRAQQIAKDFPHVPWRDPFLGDGGIDVPWPPLFDELIATAALIVHGAPTPEAVARIAAWSPVAIGIATIPLVAWLAAIFGGADLAFGAALLLALSVPHAFYSLFGRSDQHVLELLFTVCVILAYAAGLKARSVSSRCWTTALVGVAIAGAFWNWQGSALNLLFLAAFVSAWHIQARGDEPQSARPAAVLAAGCLVGAVVLSVTILMFGPERSLGRMSALGVTGLHVLLVVVTGIFAAGLWWARRHRPRAGMGRRLLEPAVLSLAMAGVVVLVPGALDGTMHGLAALLKGNRWYASIGEFNPLLFGGRDPLLQEGAVALAWYGLTPILVWCGAAALCDRWRREPARRPLVLLLGTWGVVSLALAILRYRFALYAAPPVAIWSWLGLRFAQERWVKGLSRGRIGQVFLATAVAAATIGPIVVFVRSFAFATPRASLTEVLEWLRDVPDATAAHTVYARWDRGHHIRVLANRPAIANPFGTEGGERGFQESLRVSLSTDEQYVEEVLREREAGYFLAEDPRADVLDYQDIVAPSAPPIARVTSSWWNGKTLVETERYRALVSYRLYAHDGSATEAAPALGGFRLLFETEPADAAKSDRPAYALFGFVRGARLDVRGTPPGGVISASMVVRANTGRVFTWRTYATSDTRGDAVLRIPYATGGNGASVAEEVQVSVGETARMVGIPERSVLSGGVVSVDLGRGTSSP